jgi:uridine kinase
MNRLITLTHNSNQYQVPSGITVKSFLSGPLKIPTDNLAYNDNPVIALRMNNELLPYSARLETDATVEPQYLFSDFGKRIYRHTLSFLIAYASCEVFPDRHLVIGHSLGDGLYFHFDGILSLDPADVERLSVKIRELVASDIPIEQKQVAYCAARDYFHNAGFDATELLLSYRNDPVLTLYQCANYMDISYEPLLPSTSLVTIWELRPYSERGMLLRYPLSKDFLHIAAFKDHPKLFSVFREYKQWGNILGVKCLGAMNRICGSSEIFTFIRMNEDLQHRKISQIADLVANKGTVRVVFIAGPSSSGKTTFAKRLSIQMKLLGYNPMQISLDNYYRSKTEAPLDSDGRPDLEALEALDLLLFQENLNDLYAGKSVDLPKFDFSHNGRRFFENKPISLKDNTMLVIEGIHGLNPRLIPGVDPRTTFKIYISALTQLNLDDHNRISTTDNRILRRIVRDHRTRTTSAQQTLEMWPSVERGETLHIFPFQNEADVMINSALDYELSVLKPYVEPLLKTVKPEAREAYPTARRLLEFLDNVYPIPAELVPRDSLLREFIGGSEFDARL